MGKSPQTLDVVLRRQRGQTGETVLRLQTWVFKGWYNVIDPTGKGREPVVIGDLLNARHSWPPSHLSITKLLLSPIPSQNFRLFKDNKG